VLSALADRLPRQRVMVATDAGRAVLVALMAVPGMPLPALLALMFVLALCSPPFESARSALVADVLEGDRYAVANSITNVGLQVAQVVGFVAAGALVTVLDPAGALLIDAATFVVSAIWLAYGLQRRPAPTSDGERQSLLRDALEGFTFIQRSPRLLAIIAVLWLGTAFVYAPEGIAAPLVAELGLGATGVGILLAANPLGVTIGGLAVARLIAPRRREQLVPALVVLSLVPMVLAGLTAGLAEPGVLTFTVVVALLFVSGLGSAWMIPLNSAFVQAVPASHRGRAFGVAVSGLYGMQGLGALAAGAVTLADLLLASFEQEEAPFLGDTWLVERLERLARGSRPLVEGRRQLTEDGRAVLEGRLDAVEAVGVDRWLGGTRVHGQKPWRWNRALRRVAR